MLFFREAKGESFHFWIKFCSDTFRERLAWFLRAKEERLFIHKNKRQKATTDDYLTTQLRDQIKNLKAKLEEYDRLSKIGHDMDPACDAALIVSFFLLFVFVSCLQTCSQSSFSVGQLNESDLETIREIWKNCTIQKQLFWWPNFYGPPSLRGNSFMPLAFSPS